MKIKTRILNRHNRGCRALGYLKDKSWASVWCFSDTVFGRKNSPYKNGSTRHAIFVCNIIDCKGEASIVLEDVESAMEQK